MYIKKTLPILLLILFVTSCVSSDKKEKDRKETIKVKSAKEVADSMNAEFEALHNPKFDPKDSLADLSVKNYSIKMVEGKHKYGGKTKITYQNTLELINDVVSEAKKEMQTEEELNFNLRMMRAAKGGRLRLDVSRPTIGAANSAYFSIVVQDLSGQEIYRHQFEGRRAGGHSSVDDLWWMIDMVDIDKPIRPPFNVFVVDKIGADKPFKFSVTPNMK